MALTDLNPGDDPTLMDKGRLTMGVTRDQDVVLRPESACSDFVREFLLALQEVNFGGSPRYLGKRGNQDVFSYVPGIVHHKFRRFDDVDVVGVSELLRNFHDAACETGLSGSKETVCHMDPGPNNTVFCRNRARAFIDFDMAEPGPRIADLAYVVWSWCISSKPERGPVSFQSRQIDLVLDSYGMSLGRKAELLDWVTRRQLSNAKFWETQIAKSNALNVTCSEIQERIDWSVREYEYTCKNFLNK